MPKKQITDEEVKNLPEAHEFTEAQKIATTGAAVDYRESWRIFKIMSEFVEGFDFLGKLKNEVTILGSARITPNSKYYKIAEELGRLLAKNKFTVITGGGPGIMEATNRGAYEAGGDSVGLNIQLPFEQRINPYVKESVAFYYFFTRKVMLTSPANAFVFFPGGFGTLDEFFEVVDLMEQGNMPESPVVLIDSVFWNPILKFLREKSSYAANAIVEADLKNWHVVDTAEEAFKFIKDTTDRPNDFDLNSPDKRDVEWRIFRIMAELVEGFEFLNKVKNDVTVLGTKSIMPGSKYYEDARALGRELALNGYTTITGGGPGIMEAANRGAYEAGGESLGINMRVRGVERRNNYLSRTIGFTFPFVRKLIITAPSHAFAFFPGGYGTLHQLFELLTLVETKKVESMPLILYGREFWQPLLDFINVMYADFKTISHGDRELCRVTDDINELLNFVKQK